MTNPFNSGSPYTHTPDGITGKSSIWAQLEKGQYPYLVGGDTYYGLTVYMSLYILDDQGVTSRYRAGDAIAGFIYDSKSLDIFKQFATIERDLAND